MMFEKILKNKPFQNFFFLSLYQGVNFLALIVFIPFLTKTIGVERFGLVTVMQAICSFFYVLVDYGFSVTTVRKLSVHREDLSKVRSIIKNTIGAKLLLLIVAFPIFIILSFFFLKTQYNFTFILLSFVAVIGQAAFPLWLCQGLEENKLLFYANLLNKFILSILIVCFINNINHYDYYLFFMGIASFATGLLMTFYIIRYNLKISVNYSFTLNDIFTELSEGKEVFFSNIAISIYLSSNILILSLFASPYLVGLYGIAERIMMFLRVLLSVFVQAIYPLVCKLVHQLSFKEVIIKVLKIAIPFTVLTTLLCLLMAYFNYHIASFFTKKNILELGIVIKKLSFLPFIVSLNIVPNLIILAYGKEKIKSFILIISTCISFILSFLLVPYFKIDGTICVMYVIEFIIAITSIYYMIKLNKFSTNPNMV